MGRETPVDGLMTTEIETVSPNTKISTAAETLLEQEAGSLVALDNKKRVSGILTCTDLAEVVAENTSSTESSVDDYMTADVVTISPQASIQDAAVKMIKEDIQHLPVTNEAGEMIGMLSTTDITDYLTYSDSIGTN